MKFTEEEKQRVLAQGRATLERLAKRDEEPDALAEALAVPLSDQVEVWRLDSENREQARSNAELLAEVDKRIAAAIAAEREFMCGNGDGTKQNMGLLADLIMHTNERIEQRIEATVKPLREEIAKLHENNLASLSKTMDKLTDVHTALVHSNRTNPDNLDLPISTCRAVIN
jgi:hypothetical protein